jgi:RND family efflux transporter MFP subunit
MKRFYLSTVISLIVVLALSVTSVLAAQDGRVVASAVVVPAQVSGLGFLTSALVKEVAVKEGDQVTAGQTLVILNTPEVEYNMVAAQEAYNAAQANALVQSYGRVKHIRNGKKFWDSVPPEVQRRAEAQAASALARFEIAQATFAQSTLLAPYDATIASLAVGPGEYVNQNQVVVTVATLHNLQLETTDLSERDITRVKVGAPVEITVEALRETFAGQVIAISPIADTVGGDVVFKVTIEFEEQPKDLLWGMTAEVAIEE